MPRKPFFLLYLLCFVAINGAGAQGVVLQGQTATTQSSKPNIWKATSTRGLTLIGTWTVIPDRANESAVGTWRLVDAEGRIVAGGGWSASKSPTRWSGLWRANVSGSEAEYSGSWGSPDIGLRPNVGFATMFEEAVRAAVSGVWRSGGHSGAWTIWAFK
ncbi:MAG TPA: hypothetical protein VES88_10305 [Gemmatimonadaceae bacterium]|nr:hypothetical protein [Gemmatimonadaceae bacterium]